MKHLNALLLGSLILLLSACGGLPKPGAAPALYDFGITPAFSEGTVPVKLSRVEAIPGLESYDMRYRLAYQNPNQVFSYTQSRWGAAPADLLGQRLRHAGFSSTTAECSLRVVLETFDQVFDRADSSRGVVSIRAELIEGIGRKSQSRSTVLSAEAQANSADAKGGVDALASATNQAIEKLKGWVHQQGCNQAGEK